MPYKVQPFYNVEAPVGAGRANQPADVLLVQYLLTKVASQTIGKWNPPGAPLLIDGQFTPNLTAWILSYQKVVALIPDGVVDPQKNPHWVNFGVMVSLNASYRNHFGAKRHDNLHAEQDCPMLLRGAIQPSTAKPSMGVAP
jgi:hypothetical protein